MAKTFIHLDEPNRIRELRKAARLTLQQLADKSGIHFANIAKIEKGERGLRHDHMERLAPHLGVKEADLLNANEGGLTREERELIDTYRDLPAALRKTYDVLRECHQQFRGAADVDPRSY